MSDIMLPRRFNLTAILGVVLFIFVIVYINTAVRWPEPQPQETLNHAKNLPQAHNKVQLTKDEEPKMPPAKEYVSISIPRPAPARWLQRPKCLLHLLCASSNRSDIWGCAPRDLIFQRLSRHSDVIPYCAMMQ